MSGDELGRPKYAARPTAVSSGPPQFQADTGTSRHRARPPRGEAAGQVLQAQPVDERGRQVKKPKDGQQPATGGTVYVPVPTGRGVGYGLWRLIRFVVLIVVWLALTMVKVALSPFVHIMGGGGSRPRWE